MQHAWVAQLGGFPFYGYYFEGVLNRRSQPDEYRPAQIGKRNGTARYATRGFSRSPVKAGFLSAKHNFCDQVAVIDCLETLPTE